VKKFIAVCAVIGFVATLGVGSAFAADFVTACVKEKKDGTAKKKGKFKRVAVGTSPGSPCGNKEEEVTMVTDMLAAELQAQITINANNISTNTTNIANNTAAIGANADMIDQIKTELISSMIGGAHNKTVGPFDVVTRRFMGMFVTRISSGGELEDEGQVQQKVSANFIVTKLSVVVDEAPGDTDLIRYKLRRNGADADLNPDINAQCDITGDSTMCTSVGCQEFEMGDLIDVSINIATVEGNATIVPTRWNARIVEGGSCGVEG